MTGTGDSFQFTVVARYETRDGWFIKVQQSGALVSAKLTLWPLKVSQDQWTKIRLGSQFSLSLVDKEAP